MKDADPSTCSAAAAAAGSQGGEEAPPGKEEEGNTEQGVQDVPKKSSRLRFRKKSKQPKKRLSKGLFVIYRGAES